jgi:protein-disulfide isomerase
MDTPPPEPTPLTKAQKYEERRRQREEANKKKHTSQQGKRVARWAALILLIAAGIYGLTKLPHAVSVPNSADTLSDPVTADDWSRGKADAKVTLVEYSDFQCPACGSYYPMVKQLEDQYSDRVRFVTRHFPLAQHQFAALAARAAEAAGKQGKFWEMHDRLFTTQETWSVKSNPLETFAGYAKDLGLNVDQWRSDIDSKAVQDAVAADYASGVRSGVNATPSFYLNGKKLDPAPTSYDGFTKIIDAALAQAG